MIYALSRTVCKILILKRLRRPVENSENKFFLLYLQWIDVYF
jgi:hypothetical protein